MASQPIDRDLLFGLVALESRFIDRSQLLAAIQEWVNDRSRTLADVLESRASLTGEESTIVDAVIDGKTPDVSDDIRRRFAKLWPVDPREPAKETQAARRYRVLWAHARGGLGEVFVAEDAELHRQVALKEIQRRHAKNSVSRARFVTEAEITGNLEHPGVIPVYGMGTHSDGRPFYAMRFINGEDLATAIRKFHSAAALDFSGLEFRWLLRKLIDVCHTVAYAHSRGVIHRDLKPGNVMIGPFGETLVMDWGVAKLIGQSDRTEFASREQVFPVRNDPASGSPSPRSSATLAGQAVGTPTYMSPEQAAGKLDEVGPASDVYSLGATLFAVLTGRGPFVGSVSEVLPMVRAGRFEPPGRIKPRVPGHSTRFVGERWRFRRHSDIRRRWAWPRTSSAGWRMSRSVRGAILGRIEHAGGCGVISRWLLAGPPRLSLP